MKFSACSVTANSFATVRRANVDAILTSAGRRTPSHSFFPRRGAGVAEQGCLLSSYPDKIGIGGSNPPLSATLKIKLGFDSRFRHFLLFLERFRAGRIVSALTLCRRVKDRNRRWRAEKNREGRRIRTSTPPEFLLAKNSYEFLRCGNPAAARIATPLTQPRTRTSAAIPHSNNNIPEGSGTVGEPSTSMLNAAVPNRSNVFPSAPSPDARKNSATVRDFPSATGQLVSFPWRRMCSASASICSCGAMLMSASVAGCASETVMVPAHESRV